MDSMDFQQLVAARRSVRAYRPDPVAALEVLGLPESVVPFAFTPLGWPADTPGPKERKPLEELVRHERW